MRHHDRDCPDPSPNDRVGGHSVVLSVLSVPWGGVSGPVAASIEERGGGSTTAANATASIVDEACSIGSSQGQSGLLPFRLRVGRRLRSPSTRDPPAIQDPRALRTCAVNAE